MYSTAIFLSRRPFQTQRVYRRALRLFAQHVGTDNEHLHEFLSTRGKEALVGDLLTFSDTLKRLNQNSQRSLVSSVMSYMSYNDIVIPKSQRKQIVPALGDTVRDKAFTNEQVRRVYEYLSPVGRAALLLLFSTGMRIGELIQIKESDIEGRVIHLKGVYTKNGKGRDVMMTTECLNFMKQIWLPQKQDYLKAAQNRNLGLVNQKRAGVKKLDDDRIIPMTMSNAYTLLMRAFRRAGFVGRIEGKQIYHPHVLRKSFRTIVGGKDLDLAEYLLGHSGYLTASYLRIDNIEKSYAEIEPLLTLFGGATDETGKIKELNDQISLLKQRLDLLERTAS